MNSSIFQKLILFLALSYESVYAESSDIIVCNFNIQFLGFTINRDDEGLAQLLKAEGCDIVVVEELVSPPSEKYLALSKLNNFLPFPEDAHDLLNLKSKKKKLAPLPGLRVYPPSPEFSSVQDALDALLLNPGVVKFDPIIPEPKATEFFDAMDKSGFQDFILSDEDTGPNSHHSKMTVSEWWLVFYNSQKLRVAKDLPHGFLDHIRAYSKDFDRVPFAFPFRTVEKNLDFVLIPVHFPPEGKRRSVRQQEFLAIDEWINSQDSEEKDFIILGDMNIQNKAEYSKISPREGDEPKWKSLNEDCAPTNTFPQRKKAKPYDHVFFNPKFTTEKEMPRAKNFAVVSLIDKMKYRWAYTNATEPYPGGRPDKSGRWIDYDHDKFRTRYSDHNPVKFRLKVPDSDDD